MSTLRARVGFVATVGVGAVALGSPTAAGAVTTRGVDGPIAASSARPGAALAAFPGRDGLIAYMRFGPRATTNVYVMGPDGNSARRLPCSAVSAEGRCGDSEPAWSRAGRLLAIANAKGLAIVTPTGALVRQVVVDQQGDPEEDAGSPAWSPDGRHLVFERGPGDEIPDIYVVRSDGTGLHRITMGRVAPAWSIGDRIASGAPNALVTTAPDGTGRRTISNGEAINLDWSPRGTRLALERHGRIFVVSGRGGGTRPLVARDGHQRHDPVWSPDGRRILFLRGDGGPSSLLQVRNLTTGRTRTLARGALEPAWQGR